MKKREFTKREQNRIAKREWEKSQRNAILKNINNLLGKKREFSHPYVGTITIYNNCLAYENCNFSNGYKGKLIFKKEFVELLETKYGKDAHLQITDIGGSVSFFGIGNLEYDQFDFITKNFNNNIKLIENICFIKENAYTNNYGETINMNKTQDGDVYFKHGDSHNKIIKFDDLLKTNPLKLAAILNLWEKKSVCGLLFGTKYGYLIRYIMNQSPY
jgi:hypothetical protein